MIIGRGLLANALREIDDEKYLLYANGISNSVLESIPRNNFEIKEIEDFAKKNDEKTFIYFSTSQVNSQFNYHRAYVKHKLLIEEIIAKSFPRYLIVRTTNLVGNNPWNNHTLFNYLYNAIITNEEIIVNPVLIRNFLDADHFATLLKVYLEIYETNKIVEIVNPVSFSMNEIIIEFEKCYSKKFNLKPETTINDFAVFELNDQLSVSLFERCGVSTYNYMLYLLKKYYTLPIVKTDY